MRYRIVLESLDDPQGVTPPRRLAALLKHALRRRRFRCVEAVQERGISFGEFAQAVRSLRAAERVQAVEAAQGRELVALRARVDRMLAELNGAEMAPQE